MDFLCEQEQLRLNDKNFNYLLKVIIIFSDYGFQSVAATKIKQIFLIDIFSR